MNARSSFSRKMNRKHLGAVRALGYTLTLGTHDGWSNFRRVITLRLSDEERAALAFWGLRSLSDDHAAAVMSGAADLMEAGQAERAGPPLASLVNVMDDATFWAGLAEPAELDAYCLASFDAMHPARRAAFLGFVQGRAAA